MTISTLPALKSSPSREERNAMSLAIRQLVNVLVKRRGDFLDASSVMGTVLVPVSAFGLSSNPHGECVVQVSDIKYYGTPSEESIVSLFDDEKAVSIVREELHQVKGDFAPIASWCALGVSEYNMYSPSHPGQMAVAYLAFGSGHYAEVTWRSDGSIVACRTSIENLGAPATGAALKRLAVAPNSQTDSQPSLVEQLTKFFASLNSSIKNNS